MIHDILHPLPGISPEDWHRATALRYHAPAYAVAFNSQVLLFDRSNWNPVYWGPDPVPALIHLSELERNRPRPAAVTSVDLNIDDILKDIL